MSTVRNARTRFSGTAKRERNSAAASRIAAGLSPRGQVRFASSNSENGLSPTFSGCSITDISTAPIGSLGGPRRLVALAAPDVVAAIRARPVFSGTAGHDVPSTAPRHKQVVAGAAGQPVPAGSALHPVIALPAADPVVARTAVQAVVSSPPADPVVPA